MPQLAFAGVDRISLLDIAYFECWTGAGVLQGGKAAVVLPASPS